MKYDIAKNEDGPLRKTMKLAVVSQDVSKSEGKRKKSVVTEDKLGRERHPGLDERLGNIEKHFAVRYGKYHSDVCA
jgi:hypothetical protein